MDQVPPAGWAKQENSLTRTIQRKDFVEALAFLLAVGRLSEMADHHPEVDLRYNKLHLNLTTHSAGHNLTPKDFSLAQQINALAESDIRPIAQELRERLTT